MNTWTQAATANKQPASAGTLGEKGCCWPSAQVLTLRIIGAIKLPPNQKRQRTGKKRLKGHIPKHIQYIRLHLSIYIFWKLDQRGCHLWHGFGMVSWSQIFPWNRSWLNKNRFHEKEGGQFLHINGIYCVLLAINSSKQRDDNQCLARYRWCLLSVYHDIVTCSQQKLKNFIFFISFVDNHISPYF